MTSHLQNVDLPDILRVETTQHTGITDIQGEVTMNSITYIGMDVHTTNYTLCAFTLQTQTPIFERILKTIFLSGIGRGAQRMLVHYQGFVTHWPRALPAKH